MTPNTSNDAGDAELSQEDHIQLAIAAYNNKSIPSLRQASKIFNVPFSTLQARNSGRRSVTECQQSQQRLTV
ncbi:hypothetical protein K469DRAFT_244541 [Zopfia rhizophila CBS 207.26]|uniref:HTH psq-type domain-containing protein n=1 Tax=Zopfia rhizophila CBS 207.26 TaxID=1314779 RepID=A0A6A6ERN9_9PEZI|nr:hypothetical protein K469DRAFT_244541 [Zopfia rhizophila CBS 207.26]